MSRSKLAAALVVAALVGVASAGTTTFDNGIEGWGLFFANDGPLGDFLEPTGGNPGAHLRWTMVDTFGATLKNDSNPDTIGDYSRFNSPVYMGVDVKVDELSYFGLPAPRSLVVELVDYNEDPNNPYPYTSVWYNLGVISEANTSDWTSFGITIDDPTSTDLPAGWGGYGAEDPDTYEPILPPDRTFASVLANVEEVRFTTYEPGYFYGFTNFQVRFDNVTVTPEPSSLALLALAGLLIGRRR